MIKPLLFLISSWSVCIGAEPFSVSGLKEGESLEIHYESRGCFHNSTTDLVISKGMVRFFDIQMEWNEEKKEFVEIARNPAGQMALEKADATGLDKLLKFYAGEPDGGCTTVDEITVRLIVDGEVKREADYTDGSCSASEVEGVIIIHTLQQKLVKQS
ncbi:MAG: hypothetical protein NWT08_05715 [Akkermansiaceae bacterium]|jgi:hypothetical protein|nr:hypothetical protein [Akkermansiaceae bacterium]MDP4645747.1 hypothetical protein [Akkermansiaceae bacterium]MDP4720588.1 hypothetical protein [Akkermansiaceae bacterium]MDP4781504.1 hypothetical protein [Akkermansiaceae bacterium]MDP4847607.1 hypothetical protein [Akkermansiaceae bacterium]